MARVLVSRKINTKSSSNISEVQGGIQQIITKRLSSDETVLRWY